MATSWHFIISILIWGATWYAIKLQGVLPAQLSVMYRFLIASFCLLAWCALRGKILKIDKRWMLTLILQGACQFSLSYLFIYQASYYLTSGLNAILFSFIIIFNMSFSAIVFNERANYQSWIGGFISIGGLVCIFAPEVLAVKLTRETLFGIGLALFGTALASCGNILSSYHTRGGISVTVSNTLSMVYGTLNNLFICLITHTPFTLDLSWSYMGSLIFLALFGTVFAFGSYMTLVGRLGAGNAAYTSLCTPIVALLISQALENYIWSPLSIIGISLIVLGNSIAVMLRKKKIKTQKAITP